MNGTFKRFESVVIGVALMLTLTPTTAGPGDP